MLSLKPEILLPSHGDPIVGAEKITTAVTRYRDAIQYVHDETVKGMNDGKDVYTLMREIKLPAELDVGDAYGKVSWSVAWHLRGLCRLVRWRSGEYVRHNRRDRPMPSWCVWRAVPLPSRNARSSWSTQTPAQALQLAGAALAAEPQQELAVKARVAALKALLQKKPQFERARVANARPTPGSAPGDAGTSQR